MRHNDISIDFLNIGRPCNLSCAGCWYVSENNTLGLTLEGQEQLVLKVIANYPGAAFLVYPQEITTNPEMVPFLKRLGQRRVVTNGTLLEPMVDTLRDAAISQVSVTLFGTRQDQAYYNGTDAAYYGRIKAGIAKAVERGMRVVVSNILDCVTAKSIPALAETCATLGVPQIIFHRRVPRGNGDGEVAKNVLREEDMPAIVGTIENLKPHFRGRLRLSMGLNFGPNLHGKTSAEARRKVSAGRPAAPSAGGLRSRLKGPRLCPVVGGWHRAVSLQSGNVYWCCSMLSRPDLARIGAVDPRTGLIAIDNPVDLSFETLSRRLRGGCAKGVCPYHAECLGGCRATATSMAELRGEADPIYAGLDVCMTRVYAQMRE